MRGAGEKAALASGLGSALDSTPLTRAASVSVCRRDTFSEEPRHPVSHILPVSSRAGLSGICTDKQTDRRLPPRRRRAGGQGQ